MKRKLVCIVLVLCLSSLGATAASAAGLTSVETKATSVMGLGFIERAESYSATMYTKASVWYIGYGTRCAAGAYPDGISQADAETLLTQALKGIETTLNSFFIKNNIVTTQFQFDALASFTYNLGTGWMDPSNRISSYLINGIANYSNLEIVNAIGTWCHTGKTVNDGLTRRRMAEANLFLYGEYGDVDNHKYSYVIFDAGKGSVEHDIYFFDTGLPYNALPVATLSSYTFNGWYITGGSSISINDIAGDNLSVSAKWSDGATAEPLSNKFSDVCEGDWFYPYVCALSKNNVISGYPDGNFHPGNTTNCGEALKLILLSTGYGIKSSVTDHWASGYLDFAVSKGLLAKDEIKDLDATISRQQIAEIAAKALGLSGSTTQSPFSDTFNKYVLALYDSGIVEGSIVNGSLSFMPDSYISRSEISAIIWRIDNAVTGAGTDTDTGLSQIQYGSKWLDVLQGVPVNVYDNNSFSTVDGFMQYNSADVKTTSGIDVSSFQGVIDWQRVKAAGIEFAIIRLGYRGYGNGSMNLDACFKSNIQGALNAGVKVGVYFFSQAITELEAVEEANFILANIQGYNLTYPVVFDWETINASSARTNGLDPTTLSLCAKAFYNRIASGGYTPMIYFTRDLGYIRYDLSKLTDYKFWFAQYSPTPSFYYDFQMWQYSSTGTVDGISGNVDMNISFSRE